MKTLAIAAAAMSAVTAAYATPTVTGTTIEQQSSRTVKVTYTLDEDAVVTLDILTNATADAWVSIGAENITHTWGDVNVLVTGAGTHTLYWAPEKSWTEQVGEKYTVKALVKAWAKDAPPDYMVVDPNSYLGKLRTLTGIDTFDLPTEARWEYACRAGARGAYNNGDDVGAVAWYKNNSGNATHSVGEKLPNAWGLYDMLGNVREICLEWLSDDLGAGSVIEPAPTAKTDPYVDGNYYKVARGGSYDETYDTCRNADRTSYVKVATGYQNTGFRLTCEAVAK